MSIAPLKAVKLFVASGSELKDERQETVLVVHELRKIFPDLNLEVVQWETDIPSGSYDKKRIQDKINPLLEQCPVVLVLFYSRLGGFTLEEYRLAMEKNKKVFLYFKTGFSSNTGTGKNGANLRLIRYRKSILLPKQTHPGRSSYSLKN